MTKDIYDLAADMRRALDAQPFDGGVATSAVAQLQERDPAKLKRARSLVGTSDGRPSDDYYPSPAWVTQALVDRETFTGGIWEPACGDGAMSKVLEANGHEVRSTDLVDRGYGEGGHDFLQWLDPQRAANVVTNPPFKHAQEFAARGLAVTPPGGKVALFVKLAFLEGARRRDFFRRHPPARVWVFSERVTLTRDGKPMENGGMIAFCWVVWENGIHTPTTLGWI